MAFKQKLKFACILFLALSMFGESVYAGYCKTNETRPDADDCTKYYVCCTGEFVHKTCDSDKYWNSKNECCEIINGNNSCKNCVEESTKKDCTDCTKYMQCKNGKYESVSCQNGDWWNPESQKCEKDINHCRTGSVTPQTPPIRTPTTTKPSTPTPTTTEPTTPTPTTTKPTTPTPTTTKPTTPTPTTTKPTTPTPTTTKTTTPTPTTTKPTTPTPTTTKPTTPTPTTTKTTTATTTPASQECKNNGEMKEDDEDCSGYFECCDKVYVKRNCPNQTYFDPVLERCIIDWNGVCLSPVTTPKPTTPTPITTKPTTPTPITTKPTTPTPITTKPTTPTPITTKPCTPTPITTKPTTPTPVTCTNEEIKADPVNCAGYLQCNGTEYVKVNCPDKNYFDTALNKCMFGTCIPVTPTPPPPNCTEGNMTADESDCAGYFQCIGNSKVKRSCPKGTYFNSTLELCVIDADGYCIPKVCEDECCDYPNDSLLPVDKNCSAFIHCVYGMKIQQKCPNNLQFNNETKECDFPENVKCDDGSAPPSGPTAGPSGTYCESKGPCVGKPDGTMLADSQNACSRNYIVCQCECVVNFSCTSGLVFNEKLTTCDWPANVEC